MLSLLLLVERGVGGDVVVGVVAVVVRGGFAQVVRMRMRMGMGMSATMRWMMKAKETQVKQLLCAASWLEWAPLPAT